MADTSRILQSLEYNCGSIIMDALRDPQVIEIMLNPDGNIWIERYGSDQELVGTLKVPQSKLILSLVASALDMVADAEHPVIEGLFPLDGSRFEGLYPPIVGPGASFSLRKKAKRVITMQEYIENGAITAEVVPIIKDALVTRKNIVVVGGTSSGKTTFCNGIIHLLNELCPNDRLLILEDTPELQSKAPNTVFLQTSELAKIGMRELTRVCMRYAPKRIFMGEVRDCAALELLKLWNTGYPGGIGTFHAESAAEALQRLEELVEEAGVGTKQGMIGRAIDVILFMQKNKQNQRVLSEIIEVKGFSRASGYDTNLLYQRTN